MTDEKKFVIFEKDLNDFESQLDDLKSNIDDFDATLNQSRFGKILTFVQNNSVQAQLILYNSDDEERLNKISEEVPMEQEEDHRRFLIKVSLKNFISYLTSKNNIQGFKITIKGKEKEELIDIKRISINYKDKIILLE